MAKEFQTKSLKSLFASKRNVVTVRKSTWTSIVDGREAQRKPLVVDMSNLPTAPGSTVDIGYSTLPNIPPFVAHIADLSFETDDKKLRQIFSDLNPVSTRTIQDGPRSGGVGLVEFETRESLTEALKRTNNRMVVSTFQLLPIDILFEIFGYLSPVDMLQSFLSLNRRFSTIVIYKYLWHIHVGGNRMSLSMFIKLCANVFKLIGGRVVSLRITLTNTIGGWSLVSSSLKYHQTTLLRRLHLIDIKPHEFDKLLRNRLIARLHTLIVDVTGFSPFNYQVMEGAYLAKVCSQLPELSVCRLPFNFCHRRRNQLAKYSTTSLMILPKLSNTIHLHTLTLGINTSRFLQRLLECIPFIENLSVGVNDENMNDDTITLPAAVDARLIRHLSCLRLNCLSNISFHRAIALLSSVFGQLKHWSLKLQAFTSLSDPLIILGDTIQQLCIDHLNPLSTYTLNLCIRAKDDVKDKIHFNSFVKAPFTGRKHPPVIILKDLVDPLIYSNIHTFIVYTVPYNGSTLEALHFSENSQTHRMSIAGINLYSYATELLINAYEKISYLLDLANCTSSISRLVPWSLLTQIIVDNENTISATELEAIIERA